ncbi:retrovirus-related pol polyprotein from transposon TNT 1-94 [Tanacetum coccineum]
MFDEYMEPPRIERPVSPAPAVQVPVNSAGTPSSTTIDQDAPSPSYSPSSSALQSPCLHQGVAGKSTLMEDNPLAPVVNNPFINVFAPEPNTMSDVNVNAPAEQAPVMAPPARTDDQILPRIRWVPIGKSNCYLDVERSQSNPIYKIAVDILKHTKFFRAFTASLTIPLIYIQQFLRTPFKYDNKTGNYSCQLDEQWFDLTKDTLRETTVQSLQSDHPTMHFLPHQLLMLLSKPVLRYLKFSDKGTKQEVFGMPILNDLITDDIRVFLTLLLLNHARPTKPKASRAIKPRAPKLHQEYHKPAPAKPQEKKRKLVTETSEAPSPAKRSKAEKEPKIGDEEVDLQKAVEESLKEFHSACQGPLPPVVIREPESGKFQPLPEVQGKGKEKVSDEQVALDLLTLQTPKKRSPADQYIFQRRTSTQTEPTGHDESSSLYAELGLTDSEMDSDEEVSGIDAGVQDEGQAGPNPDLEHMNLEASDTSLQPNPEQMDEEFTTTAYPNV